MTAGDTGFLFTFFNLAVARQYWQVIASGALVTVGVGAAVVVTGTALGLLLAIVRALGRRTLSLPIVAFADIMRSLPPLVVLIVLYFGLPALGLPLSAFAVTWVSLSLVLAAYAEESIWAGISAVPAGQLEAARSTGMRWWQAMRWVVLPQAHRAGLGGGAQRDPEQRAGREQLCGQPHAVDDGRGRVSGRLPAAGRVLALARATLAAEVAHGKPDPEFLQP
jgi:His/Glu/Gln/Arg/opine family amino acid ABC transporter permease subunit